MASLLNQIDNPHRLHEMSLAQLELLAEELRSELISVVSRNGGHLAPNLGVVELTIALHSVFVSPTDKLVWDVGHQSYVHKILTGRRDDFASLRALGGISGFPKRSESEHDCFDTGHSSTSVSAALGMACARDLKGEANEVVAVIGDGSLTGGMAFEALNHAGHLGKRIIVVLNDNEMSITKNVGALARYLTKIRMDPTIRRVKEDIASMVARIPAVGGRVVELANRVKDSLKYMVVPGMFFEELGFTYLGPIDGHDLRQMRRVFTEAKARPGPVIVHVVTVKGKGYYPAQSNPEHFHSVAPFNADTGLPAAPKSTETYTDVFGQEIVRLGCANPRIVAITAAMAEGTGLVDFASRFSDRFFDVGIAEQHAVTLAAGMAVQGYFPVVAIYSSFMQRAYDQLLHDVCLQNLPVTFILDRAGLSGPDGPTHHGVYDVSYLRHMPGMTILAPSDSNELSMMLDWAIGLGAPTALRIPKSSIPSSSLDHSPVTAGTFETLHKGHEVAIIALGSMVTECLAAQSMLLRRGVDVTLVNARFAKPLDSQALYELANEHRLIITVEEHVLEGGFGSAIIEELPGTPCRVVRLGLPASPVEHGPRETLLAKHGLSGATISASVIAHLGTKRYRLNRKASSLHLLVH